jgi:predicted metal-dependent phosphoesterase TrpH
LELIEQIADSRKRRAERILDRLFALGVRVPFEKVRERVGPSGPIGRPHIAEALMSGGWVQSFPEAFARYLGKDAPAYVAKDPIRPGHALGVIRAAGGVTVLAHPGAYQLDTSWGVFLKEGLQGLETVHPKHTPEAVEGFRKLAARHGLVATGGSDFHGRGNAEIPIGGIRIDAAVVDEIYARKEEQE